MHTNIFNTLFSIAIMTPKELSDTGIDTTDINLFTRRLLHGQYQPPYAPVEMECISIDLEKSINKLSRGNSYLVDFCNVRDLAIQVLRYNGLQGDVWDWRQMV